LNWKTVSPESQGYFHELLANVHKLELDYVSGRSNLQSHRASLAELKRKTYQRSIHPYQVGGWWAASIGILLLAFSNNADDLLSEQAMVMANVLDGLSLLGIACLGLAVFLFHVYFSREAEHDHLFHGDSGIVGKAGPSFRAAADEGQA
jgi:hypothetical protein